MKTRNFKAILLFSIFAISYSVYAQDCKYTTNQTDPITNEENKVIDVEVSDKTIRKYDGDYLVSGDSKDSGWPKSFFFLFLEKKGNKYFIRYNILKNGRDVSRITSADTNYFKLSSGVLIKAVAQETAPIYEESSTRYKVYIQVTKEQMEELSKSPLMFVRLGIPGKPTFSSNEKKAKKLMEAAACIVK